MPLVVQRIIKRINKILYYFQNWHYTPNCPLERFAFVADTSNVVKYVLSCRARGTHWDSRTHRCVGQCSVSSGADASSPFTSPHTLTHSCYPSPKPRNLETPRSKSCKLLPARQSRGYRATVHTKALRNINLWGNRDKEREASIFFPTKTRGSRLAPRKTHQPQIADRTRLAIRIMPK